MLEKKGLGDLLEHYWDLKRGTLYPLNSPRRDEQLGIVVRALNSVQIPYDSTGKYESRRIEDKIMMPKAPTDTELARDEREKREIY